MTERMSGWLSKRYVPQVILLACCLAGFWPLSFGIFSVKNDAIHYFLPFRYNISCAIRSMELPLWSPFVYLGTPLHGDMQSGAWNPLVWLLSLFRTYDLTVFHIETLIYIYIGGLGLFQLSKNFSNDLPGRLLISISYMLCGYMMGSAQFINWLATAAFLPFVLHYYYRLLKTAEIKDGILTAIFYFLLLVCGYPADFVFTFYILLFMLLAAALSHLNTLTVKKLKQYVWLHSLMALCFMGLSAPAILSYLSLLPLYGRGSGTTLQAALENSYSLNHLVSLLNPWPTWTNTFSSPTDVTGRNMFIGIIPLSFFLLWLLKLRKNDLALFILLVISLLFTLGDGFVLRGLAYETLPGMDTFRHPSHFRLYIIIPMLLAACKVASKYPYANVKRLYSFILLSLASFAFALTLYHFIVYYPDVSLGLPAFSRSEMKVWLTEFSYHEALVLGLLLQVFFLMLAWLTVRMKYHFSYLLLISFLNMFAFQSLFPATVVSQKDPKVINNIIRKQDIGMDHNSLSRPLSENDVDKQAVNEDVRLYSLYNKKIALTKHVYSPSTMTSLHQFLASKFMYDFVNGHPALYFAQQAVPVSDTLDWKPDSAGCRTVFLSDPSQITSVNHCNGLPEVKVAAAGYNFFKAEVSSMTGGYVVLTQNYHPAWEAMIDGDLVPIRRSNLAFMSVLVPAGKHEIYWKYNPRFTYYGLIIFVSTLAALILYFNRRKLQILRSKFF